PPDLPRRRDSFGGRRTGGRRVGAAHFQAAHGPRLATRANRHRPHGGGGRASEGAHGGRPRGTLPVRICVVGKFPPIQGGVSTRTYWTAHGLAALGHEVHVVTNAKEAEAPFRMLMRPTDWARCGGAYGRGSVTVHWTDPADWSQYH